MTDGVDYTKDNSEFVHLHKYWILSQVYFTEQLPCVLFFFFKEVRYVGRNTEF